VSERTTTRSTLDGEETRGTAARIEDPAMEDAAVEVVAVEVVAVEVVAVEVVAVGVAAVGVAAVGVAAVGVAAVGVAKAGPMDQLRVLGRLRRLGGLGLPFCAIYRRGIRRQKRDLAAH
jgi:hypothetical protein